MSSLSFKVYGGICQASDLDVEGAPPGVGLKISRLAGKNSSCIHMGPAPRRAAAASKDRSIPEGTS